MVQVVFGFINTLTGNPMPNVECTLDGVQQISGQNGLVTFTTTQGTHQYVIRATGFKVGPGSVDVYDRPIYDQGEIRVEWLPDPSYPWPEDSVFYLSVYMVEGIPSPQIGSVIPIAIGLGALLLLKSKK
jgi:hypothetical protein